MSRKCERCGIEIPDDYGNLLCDEHYRLTIEENEQRKQKTESQAAAEILKNKSSPIHPDNIKEVEPMAEAEKIVPEAPQPRTEAVCDHSTCGITDPNYKENPEADDKDQVLANLAQFIYTHRGSDHPKGRKHGILLYYPQRNMYNFIRNYCMKQAMSHPQYPKYLWKPKIVDVGCGSGVGSNVLSQEADMVWGIDKNEFSIEFAKEAFTREKNGEYYSGQLTFDVIDIMNDNRQFMAFDIVVAIEVAEHIWDIHGFLTQLKRFTKRDKQGNVIKDHGTEFFISTPNRAHAKLRKDRPENLFHCREWTKSEFQGLLKKHFEQVDILDQQGNPAGEQEDLHQIIFAKCAWPI
mgnify:CR=1 FL=1